MSTSPAFSNILQLSHNDCLINSSATYPAIIKATSALFSCRKCSAISCVLVSKIYWITVTHSWFSDARSSSEKLIFSLITFNLLLITFIWFLPTCTHLHVLGETSFISISLQSSSYHVAPWCSGYHYCTTSFNKAWTQVLRRFKPSSRRIGDSCDGEDLRKWSRLEIRLIAFRRSTIPQKQFIIFIFIIFTYCKLHSGSRGFSHPFSNYLGNNWL